MCGSGSLADIIDLGHQPICNAVLTRDELDKPETYYPLRLVFCQKCHLVQLSSTIPQSVVFSERFNYLSGKNRVLVEHFRALADSLRKKHGLRNSDLVCDIGSNDGSFLAQFRRARVRTLGVEPTRLPAKASERRGISTVHGFFNTTTAKRIVKEHGHPRLVTAMNVLAHTEDVHEFLRGVRILMDRNSIFVSESHYLPSMIENLEYDMIYHEHLRYYTLETLIRLFAMHGLITHEAELSPTHGGSIITVCRRTRSSDSKSVRSILRREHQYGSFGSYRRFATKVMDSRTALVKLLTALRAEGERVVGIGAPMKASTLLNFCHIDTASLECLTEVNPLKIGRFAPGVHIPIVDERKMLLHPPKYAVILSWTISDSIMKSLRSEGYSGKFIIPIPKAKIVS